MFENLSDDELLAATAALSTEIDVEIIECCDCHQEFKRDGNKGQRPKRCPQCAWDYIVHNGCKKAAKVIGIKQGHLFSRRSTYG